MEEESLGLYIGDGRGIAWVIYSNYIAQGYTFLAPSQPRAAILLVPTLHIKPVKEITFILPRVQILVQLLQTM